MTLETGRTWKYSKSSESTEEVWPKVHTKPPDENS
jgi:hypothetical protein